MTDPKEYSISLSPNSAQLDDIYLWLKEEEQDERLAGFFCNWNSIAYSFENNEMAIICIEDYPIGFMTWFSYERTAKIQIAEIKPGHRKQGLGKILTYAVLEHLKLKGILAVRLHCQPQQSEGAWKKIGFRNFPDVPEMSAFNDAEEGRHLYQVLVPHLEPLAEPSSNETLDLWPTGSYMKDRIAPRWYWNLTFKNDTCVLEEPIIFPAKYKWNIRWKKDGRTIKEDDIKYFSKSDIHFDTFLMITELP